MRRRIAARLKQSDVAKALKCSVARISYIESGDRSPTSTELIDVLLPLFQVTEPDRHAYIDALRGAEEGAWWDGWDEEEMPKPQRRFVGLEAGARQLRVYHPGVVPGLLQTPEYTKAILASLLTVPQVRIPRLVQLRRIRQDVLFRATDPVEASFVLDEAVLRRVVGGAATLRSQLAHLADVAEAQPNIELHVAPFSVGATTGLIGEFTIMEFQGLGDPLVFREGFTEWQFIEEQRIVRRYSEAFDRLETSSLEPDESIAMVRLLAAGER